MKTLSDLGISPAPWNVDELNDVAKKNHGIVVFSSCFDAQSKADARLIAAVPELYEALREIYEQVEGGDVHFTGASAWLAKARAALENAGGAE